MRSDIIFISFVCLLSCTGIKKDSTETRTSPLFELIHKDTSGILFRNDLKYSFDYNTYTYRNFYNGGGVALGDINNDGLIDIYFTGNLLDNKLYLNLGNFKFKDITAKAGVACPGVWSTGASFVDINGDGFLDLYVCKAGKPGGKNRHNELFINKGDLTFEEKSKEYGLDFVGLSIHSAFADFDKDGDLDCYLLSNSLRSVGGFDLQKGLRDVPDPEGNKLLLNDGGHFIDISSKAGIYTSKIGYGLGITLSDFNNDGWTDIFISNDFFERDYLYINTTKGGFLESGTESINSMSMGSMGADAADLNNDLLTDLFVTEMLPKDLRRKKTKTQYESWDKYTESVEKGYHHQFARNVLQRNMGDGTFLELGRFAGVSDSDWSWAALLQDFDNDGLKDIFVSNGIGKDLLDKDYLSYYSNNISASNKNDIGSLLIKLIDSMPTAPIQNRMYKNGGHFKFQDVSTIWGFDALTFSNGSAYGDLNNDGALDLVINNVNNYASVYKNVCKGNYLTVQLQGVGKNTNAIGSKVFIKVGSTWRVCENYFSRGFQSSTTDVLHFGLGENSSIDSLIIQWPDEKSTVTTSIKSNQRVSFKQKEANQLSLPIHAPIYQKIVHAKPPIDFKHQEITANLFAQDRLMPYMLGFTGPAIEIADVNNDKKDDIFVGGAKGQSSVLFLSTSSQQYNAILAPFQNHLGSEVTDAAFFDADNDADLDLYVAHGGRAFTTYSAELDDILYINDGTGVFSVKPDFTIFPSHICTGAVCIADINDDGLQDIVVGESVKYDEYGSPGHIYLLINKGNNQFDSQLQPNLANVGMISDVQTLDINDDTKPDLVSCGHWMGIKTFINKNGVFQQGIEIPNTVGLWNTVEVADLNKDGQNDLLCGNQGANSFFKSKDLLYIEDIDRNGMQDLLLFELQDGEYYLKQDIDELFNTMPVLKKKLLYYKNASELTLPQFEKLLNVSSKHKKKLDMLESAFFINYNGQFKATIFPSEFQYSSLHAIAYVSGVHNSADVFAGGNRYRVKPQFGKDDASSLWAAKLLLDKDTIRFHSVRKGAIQGEIRDLKKLGPNLLISKNGGKIESISLQ